MPLHDFTFHLIISTLENETQLGRVLFYPEVSDLDVRGDHLRKTLWELTAEQIDRQPLLEFHRRSRRDRSICGSSSWRSSRRRGSRTGPRR